MKTRTWPRACRLLRRLLTRHQALPRTQKRVVLQAAQAHVVLEHGHQGAAKHCCAQVGPRWTPATVSRCDQGGRGDKQAIRWGLGSSYAGCPCGWYVQGCACVEGWGGAHWVVCGRDS